MLLVILILTCSRIWITRIIYCLLVYVIEWLWQLWHVAKQPHVPNNINNNNNNNNNPFALSCRPIMSNSIYPDALQNDAALNNLLQRLTIRNTGTQQPQQDAPPPVAQRSLPTRTTDLRYPNSQVHFYEYPTRPSSRSSSGTSTDSDVAYADPEIDHIIATADLAELEGAPPALGANAASSIPIGVQRVGHNNPTLTANLAEQRVEPPILGTSTTSSTPGAIVPRAIYNGSSESAAPSNPVPVTPQRLYSVSSRTLTGIIDNW